MSPTSTHPDGPPEHDDATPLQARGLIDFLNSRASARRPERFDTPEHAERFLSRCDLGYDQRQLTVADAERLRLFRDALMNTIDRSGEAGSWAAVNEIIATVPVHLQTLAGPRVTARAARTNAADTVIATVLSQLVDLIAKGRWDRIGACARCRRVFYDSTRSHTRRWCSYATCGNRANVATHRDRKRSA